MSRRLRSGRLWRCLVPSTLLAGWGKALAAAQAVAESAPPAFAGDDLGLIHHIAVGLGCVVVIALLGWATVVWSRKHGWPALGQPSAELPLRVLAVRRVGQRLQVAAVQVSPGQVVVIADNGQAIVKIAEMPAPPSPAGQ